MRLAAYKDLRKVCYNYRDKQGNFVLLTKALILGLTVKIIFISQILLIVKSTHNEGLP